MISSIKITARASIIAFAVSVAALAALIFRESILAVGFIGISIQVLSAMLMVWARVTFGHRSFHASATPTKGGLITSGPYRFIRHPIYASLMYFYWTAIATHFTLIEMVLGIVITIGFIIRILAEERLILEHYPEYAAYAVRTKRIIPFII
jgi:protein-S-isoprenylcysteine O-methyltransferase Ste14